MIHSAMENLALATSEPTGETPAAPVITQAMREWSRCRHWIERAHAKGPGLETMADVEASIEAGRAVFWAGPDSALITRFDVYPAGKTLVVCYADGDGDHLEMAKSWLPRLEHFGRHFDCRYLSVECQEDSAPLMQALDLKPTYTHWMKELPVVVESSVSEQV
jgi:hypothetical protein